ncbi:MAG: hypothetical protein QOF68_973 [Gaiellales bacterium]|nr:hypothetical protein [Gaiellales bacterium]
MRIASGGHPIVHRNGAVRTSVLVFLGVLILPFAYAGGMGLVTFVVVWAVVAVLVVRRLLFGAPPKRDRHIV